MLSYTNAFELLIAVVLSAQTTDAQVNKITPALFSRYPDSHALAGARQEEVEGLIHSTGFYRSKARNIIGASKVLVEDFGGRVPQTMEELVRIPGVGRKSAGVVLHHIFDKPAIIVDTHFGRVVRRLGLTAHEDPKRVEQDIAAQLDRAYWSEFSMTANLHGRALCHARKPRCSECFLLPWCAYGASVQGVS